MAQITTYFPPAVGARVTRVDFSAVLIIRSVQKTNRCVTAHEAVTRGGFGAELTAVVQHGAFDYLDAPVERVGAKFAPLAFAPAMEQWVVPHAADVLAAIKRTVARS